MIELYAAVAGILIGLGVIINTLAANPVLGALMFSFGLLTIIKLQLPLYTGQIGFWSERKKIDLLKILIFNLIGIGLCVGLFLYRDPNFMHVIADKAALKFGVKTYLQLLIDGFFCGMLIHFAVKCKEMLITVLAVMIFILIGAEHCIADFPYLLMHWNIDSFLKFLCIVMGNSLGAILIEKMLKKKGN